MKRLIAAILIGTLTASPAYALRAEGPQSSGLEELERDLGGRPINRRALLQWAIGVALGGSAIGGGMSWSVRASDLARLRDTRQALETLPWGFPGSASANIIPVPDTHQGKLGALYRIDVFDKTGHPAKAPYGYLLLNLQHARPELITIALCAFEDAPLGSKVVQQITKQTLTLDRRQLEALSLSTPDGRRQARIALRLDQPPLEARSFQHLAMWIFAEPGTSRAAPLSAIVYTDLALQQYLSEEQASKIRSLADVSIDSARSLVPPTLLGGAVGLLAGIGGAAAFDEALREYLRSFVSPAPGPSTAPATGTLPAVPLRNRGQEMVNDFARNAEDPQAVVVLSYSVAQQLYRVTSLLEQATALTKQSALPLYKRWFELPGAVKETGVDEGLRHNIVELSKRYGVRIHVYGDREDKAVQALSGELARQLSSPIVTPASDNPARTLASILQDMGVPGEIATPAKAERLLVETGVIASVIERSGLEEPNQAVSEVPAIPKLPRMLTTVQRSVKFTRQNLEVLHAVIVGPGAVGILPVLVLADHSWGFRVIPRDLEQAQRVRDWMRQQGLKPEWVMDPPEAFSPKTYLKAVRTAQDSLLGGERIASSAFLIQGFHDPKIIVRRTEQQPVVREVIVLPSRDDLLPLKIQTILPRAYGRDIQKGLDILMDEVRRVDHYLLGNL